MFIRCRQANASWCLVGGDGLFLMKRWRMSLAGGGRERCRSNSESPKSTVGENNDGIYSGYPGNAVVVCAQVTRYGAKCLVGRLAQVFRQPLGRQPTDTLGPLVLCWYGRSGTSLLVHVDS